MEWLKLRDEQCRARVVELSGNSGPWVRPSRKHTRSRSSCGFSLQLASARKLSPHQLARHQARSPKRRGSTKDCSCVRGGMTTEVALKKIARTCTRVMSCLASQGQGETPAPSFPEQQKAPFSEVGTVGAFSPQFCSSRQVLVTVAERQEKPKPSMQPSG